MGGRIGCHVSLEEEVEGIICFGYPLCGGGDRARLRDKVLRELTTPILFIQGTRDPLCPLDLFEEVREKIKAPNFLHLVNGGNHSLEVGKRQLAATEQTQEGVNEAITHAIDQFLRRHLEVSSLELGAARCAGEGNDVTDVSHAGDEHEHAFKTETEA